MALKQTDRQFFSSVFVRQQDNLNRSYPVWVRPLNNVVESRLIFDFSLQICEAGCHQQLRMINILADFACHRTVKLGDDMQCSCKSDRE